MSMKLEENTLETGYCRKSVQVDENMEIKDSLRNIQKTHDISVKK